MNDEIKVTNPDKIVFPKDKITKMDVIRYYIDVCKLMLPFVSDRLLSVIRCHDGIDGECFFKKHPTTDRDFVNVYEDGKQEYFYINNDYQLITQAQNGTIEFHVGSSNIKKIEKPNIMVFDLDPDRKLSLTKLRNSVLNIKSVLDELNLKSFLKTSGGKGYHIVVPFKESSGWERFYDFARQIASLAESRWPKDFTTNIRKDERNDKIFIDYLRNNRGSTCVSAYSIRARDGAPISMPIAWENINNIKPNEVTIKNFKKYINSAWDSFFEVNQRLK